MKFSLALIAVLSIFTLLCLGLQNGFAQSQPKRGGMVRVALNTDVGGVDPHYSPIYATTIVMNHIFERLVGYGDNFELLPVLAEKWDISDDLTTYTFYLRKGKRFHNGRELVADDIKYSIERILNPATGNKRRSIFKKIDNIEVVDKYTVRFNMKGPDANLLHSLAYIPAIMAIVPKEAVEKQGGIMKHPVGTGPYKFVEWKPDRHILVERFADYVSQPGPMNGFGGERIALVDKIKFVPIPEESVATMALMNKEIDFILYVPLKDVKKFRTVYKERGIVTDEVPGLSLYHILFGVKQPVTKNLKFRMACVYAIDRGIVAEAATRGYYTDNPSFVAQGNTYFSPHHKTWYKKDLQKAKTLLAESGYKGEEVTIITTKKYEIMYLQAVAVQAELTAAGINAKLEVMDWPTLANHWFQGDYQILSFGLAPRPDPRLAFSAMKSGGFYELNPRMQAIEDETSKTLDFEIRMKLFEEAHSIVYEQVPAVMFFSYNYFNVYWNHLKGFKMNSGNQPRFWGVWLDKN